MNRREFLAGMAVAPFVQASPSVSVKLLGTAQDGGYPQAGTYDSRNDRARQNPSLRRRAASLAILNSTENKCHVLDATPDLPAQLDLLRHSTFVRGKPSRALIDSVLLTHAHMGHYTGLMFLGLEAMDAKQVAVHCTQRMADFLSRNGPWDLLIKRNEIALKVFAEGRDTDLDAHVRFRAHAVPHRDEYTDTVGFVIHGPNKRVFYLPDSDTWTPALTEIVRGVDIAFLDGTFFDNNEMPGVDMSRFPHPRIVQTMETLKGLGREIYFTHLNNSNPAVDPASEAWRRIVSSGFKVAEDGLELRI